MCLRTRRIGSGPMTTWLCWRHTEFQLSTWHTSSERYTPSLPLGLGGDTDNSAQGDSDLLVFSKCRLSVFCRWKGEVNSKPGLPLSESHKLAIWPPWNLTPISTPIPEGRPGMSDVSPPVWNLRAVIWFHFAISSLVLLPSPVTLSVLSFSACWPFLLNFYQKILQYFSLRDRLFCMAPV